MPREFPDELLSAYLDGELAPAEHMAVEQHLAACEADRKLMDELRTLRSDLAALPRVTVDAGFTERVVQAALRARAQGQAQVRPAALTGASRWLVPATAIAVTAACLLTIIQLSKPTTGGGHPLSPAEQISRTLRRAAPGEGEAVVLRLRVPQDLPLETALDEAWTKAGIQTVPSKLATGASRLGADYREQLQAKSGAGGSIGSNSPLPGDTVEAADVLFVAAPLAQIERALTALAAEPNRRVELGSEARLAFFASPQTGGPEAEGATTGDRKVAGPPTGQSFVQRLPAGVFRLAKWRSGTSATDLAPAATPVNPRQPVHVLILVERIDAQP